MYAFGESYEGAKSIPVPIRKWLIQEYNKQKERENSDSNGSTSTDRPLTAAERQKAVADARRASNSPGRLDARNFLTPRR